MNINLCPLFAELYCVFTCFEDSGIIVLNVFVFMVRAFYFPQ